MKGSHAVITSMNKNVYLTLWKSKELLNQKNILWYQPAVSFLMWAVTICLDIAFAVSVVPQYCSNSDDNHILAAKQIFYYLSETVNLRITFKRN